MAFKELNAELNPICHLLALLEAHHILHASRIRVKVHCNPLNAELNPICYLLALLGAHHILHVSRIRFKTREIQVNLLTLSSRNSSAKCNKKILRILSNILTNSFPNNSSTVKAIPLQARTGPEGSRRLRLPDFKTVGSRMC